MEEEDPMDIPPGLQTESDDDWATDDESDGDETSLEDETSEEDLELVSSKKTKEAKKKSRSEKISESNVEASEGAGPKASLRQQRQRKEDNTQSKKKKKVKDYARNYTFASKMRCLDHSIINEFLASSICGCKKKCLKKLNTMREHGAADCVYQLRKQRFASKSVAIASPKDFCTSGPHPGGENLSSSREKIGIRTLWEMRNFCEECFRFLLIILLFAGGNVAGEKEFLRHQLQSFAVQKAGALKPKFHYRLPLIGDVCRGAWLLAAGFPCTKNSRIANLEAEIRNPHLIRHTERKFSVRPEKLLTRTQFAVAFLEEYILTHSQRSPSSAVL